MDPQNGASGSGGRWLSREKLILAIVVPVCLALLTAALTWWINRPKTELEIVKLDVVPGRSEGMLKRGEVTRSIVRQGIRSQEIRDGLDPDLILDALYGPICDRLLVPYEDIELSDSYIENLIDTIFKGVAPA